MKQQPGRPLLLTKLPCRHPAEAQLELRLLLHMVYINSRVAVFNAEFKAAPAAACSLEYRPVISCANVSATGLAGSLTSAVETSS
jgi:hypothetical protein